MAAALIAAVAAAAGTVATPAQAAEPPAAVIDEIFLGTAAAPRASFVEILFLEAGTVPARTTLYFGSPDGGRHRGAYLSYGHGPTRNGYEEHGSVEGPVYSWIEVPAAITVAAGDRLLLCGESTSVLGVACDASYHFSWMAYAGKEGGALAFGSDLVTYGRYQGDSRVVASSSRPAQNLALGRSLVRVSDTDDSYADFRYAAPTPQNLAGGTGGLPAADSDGDGHLDGADVCPYRADPLQTDFDGDGLGDACDTGPDHGPLPSPVRESSWVCAGVLEVGRCVRVPGV